MTEITAIMDHSNIKGFIIFLIVNSLLHGIVEGAPNLNRQKCVHTIKKYHKIAIQTKPLPAVYAKYAMLHFRKSNKIANGIEIVPSICGKPETNLKSLQRLTSRGNPEKVTKFEDLFGSSSSGNQGECSEGSGSHEESKSLPAVTGEIFEEIVVDYKNIPDDVRNYYLRMIPHLTAHHRFQTPTEFCFISLDNPEEINICINQVIGGFYLTSHNPKEIVQHLYQYFVIGELLSESQKHAIRYLEHVGNFFKLEDVDGKSMDSPHTFCLKIYSQGSRK